MPAALAEQRVMAAFPGDNDMEARWMAVRHLTQAYTLEALGIIDDADSASITITDTSGLQRIVVPERRAFTPSSPALKAPPDITAPLYLQRLDQAWWTQKLAPLKSLYVQVNAIANQENETFAQFAERVSREAAAPDIHNIILDLRHSAGGNGYLTAPLLRTLIHFENAAELHRLYVIIGRNTFSASHNLITDLDRIARPVFVGEPSGSRPNAISEAGRFTLPFSGLSGVLSSQFHQHGWPEDHRIWIAPDVPVGLSSQEFFSGSDPALAAIQHLISPPVIQ